LRLKVLTYLRTFLFQFKLKKMGNKKNFSISKKMKKIIITSSILALFTSVTMAELTYPIQVDNFTVIKEDINGEIIAQDNLTLQVSSTGSFGESLVYVQSNNANITKFTANGITTSATFAEGYKWLSLTGILNLESVKESYTLDNASFTNNSASTTNTTTGTYGSVLRTGKVSGTIQNSIFKGNYGYSNNQVQGTYSVGVAEKTLLNNVIFDSNTIESTNSQGGAIASFGSKEISINNSSFISNTASSQSQYAYGGAVYLRGAAWGGYADGVANISNTTFDKNTASSYSATQGGAIYIRSDITGADAQNGKISITITDSVFTNNASVVEDKNSQYVYVSGGGAVYSYDSIVNFVATEDITNVGNYASIAGVKKDDRGGFLYLKSNALTATANFNISENATMTIGNGTVGYDSIASENGTATINKTGAGSLVVNSSMEYFTGTLNVNAGTMDANNGLGAKAVNIASGATLNVGLTSTSLTSATVVNDGILGLKRGTLADGDTLTISSYSGEGTVNAFGGSFANGVFTAGKSAEFTNNVITVGSAENDVQTVSFVGADNNKLVLDFNVSGKETMTVNNITEVSEAENIVGDFITGFSVDATYNGDLSVVLSAYVGDISNPANLVAWHKADGSSIWTKLDGEVEYDASTGFASIFVEGFSSYAFSQVPEPSTYALIFGALALSLAMYRRRR